MRYWIGTQPEPEDRRQIEVNDGDASEIENLDRNDEQGTVVTDELTGERVTVRWADCGLSCRCALEFV